MAGSEGKSVAKWREDKCGDLLSIGTKCCGVSGGKIRCDRVQSAGVPPGGCHRSRGGDDDDNSTLDHDDPTHRRHSCMEITLMLIGVCVWRGAGGHRFRG